MATCGDNAKHTLSRHGGAAVSLLLVLLVLTLPVLLVSGQALPSSATCLNAVNSIGQSNILLRLAPCQSGPTPQCCSAGQALAGFPGSGPLAGCLCNPDVLSATLSSVSSSPLASSAGVTPTTVTNTLQSCGVPFSGGTGAAACPAGAAPAAGAASPPVAGAAPPAAGAAPSTTVLSPPAGQPAGPTAAIQPYSGRTAGAPAPAPPSPSGGGGGFLQAKLQAGGAIANALTQKFCAFHPFRCLRRAM